MEAIETILSNELLTDVPLEVEAFAFDLARRWEPSAVAVLFYGSCLRKGAAALLDSDNLLDFYLLVDDYERAYPERPMLARANRLLPPNVFFKEFETDHGILRAKYAVMTLDRFVADCRYDAPTSAIWARFAQPARIAYAPDLDVRSRIVSCCSEAVLTFVAAAAALQGEQFKLDQLWITAFRYTYEAELRSERGIDRAVAIVSANSHRYRELGRIILAAMGSSHADGLYKNPLKPTLRREGQRRWQHWRRKGKLLNLLRLLKAVFTFEGAVDYALWKVERHAGVRPHISAWERRHPVLASPVLLWRFYRAGAFR